MKRIVELVENDTTYLIVETREGKTIYNVDSPMEMTEFLRLFKPYDKYGKDNYFVLRGAGHKRADGDAVYDLYQEQCIGT